MWNLFSAVQPKVIKPAKSLKQQLLIRQAKNLQQIQQQSKVILNAINSTLKIISTENFSQQDINQSEAQLQNNLNSLQKRLLIENVRFQESITKRDQQKQNNQQFFKSTMKSYQNKKSELNKYIKDLQEKVQKLEMLGLKTYSLSPDQDHVLNGFNKKYIDKYLSKLQIIDDAQHDIEKIFKDFSKVYPKISLSCSTKIFTQEKPYKFNLFESLNEINSLQDLEKQLQTILVNEQVIGTILNSRIKKRQKQFQKLASQEKTLKIGLNKLQQQSQKRNKPKNQQTTINEKTQQQKPHQPKQIIRRLSKSSEGQKTKKLDVSFSDSIEQKISQEENNNIDSANKKQKTEGQEQIPSVNFLNACQDLITKTFLQPQ